MTVVVDRLERHHPRLALWGAPIKCALNVAGPMSFTGIWSPGGKGFPIHFDVQSNFILQLEGEKLWQLEMIPACEFPLVNFIDQEVEDYCEQFPWLKLRTPGPLSSILLRPGDALYVPPGTWHSAAAGEYSLALTYTLHPVDFASLIATEIKRHFAQFSAWRQFVPLSIDQDARFLAPAANIEAFFSARLDEFREVLGRIQPADLMRVYWELIGGFDLPAAAIDPVEIRRDHRLSVLHAFHCAEDRASEGAPQLQVFFTNRQLSLPMELSPFFEHLSEADSFVAQDALSWVDERVDAEWEDIRTLLQSLVVQGLLGVTSG